jgi:RNA polymerase sigma-70 factor (ECF subfamily)
MAEQVSDTILLERFVSRREQEAFAALIERHGPVVQGICRRVLHNEHDAEDVFQATFLVLARKAHSVPWRGSIARWLCSVAHRLALGTRADLSRYQRRETSVATLTRQRRIVGNFGATQRDQLPERLHPVADVSLEVERRDLRRVIDDELHHLPEKYRDPIVLCYLEGKTHEQAARHLGWPAGSVSRRLERGRQLLGRRLAHRGVSLAIGLFTLALVILSARWKSPHHGRSRATPLHAAVRSATPPHGTSAVERILAEVASGRPGPRPQQVSSLARQNVNCAQQMERHDPGRMTDSWRLYSSEMEFSALQLAQASEQNDESGILAAARRLDATCLKCHEVFRQ